MAVSPFLSFAFLAYWAISLYFMVSVHGGDFIPERVCGTLYSQNDFQGDSFPLNDFDFSSDTSKDYRASISGWLNTKSVRVAKECSMYVCVEPYFLGACHLLNENISQPNPLISQVGSANCTCHRECNCEDVVVPTYTYGWMYLNDGCQSCDSEHLRLENYNLNFSFSQSIQTIKIRRGCNLTLYGDTFKRGVSRLHAEEIIENNFNAIGSYETSCNDSAYTPPLPQLQSISDPSQIRLPDTAQGLLQLVSTNDSMARHPGILAALESLKNRRSWKNAYILVIGTPRTGIYLDTQGCAISGKKKIIECRISQALDKFGIFNSEIRIIYYDWFYGIPVKEEDDYVLMASLDEYLSNHEELKHAIPNAVVLFFDVGRPIHLFQRQLQIINGLRALILEESYPNLIFYFNVGNYIDFLIQNTSVANIVEEINSNWTFPKPTLFVTYGSNEGEYGYPKYVNGFNKMRNGEYWPLNLLHRLRISCRWSGDKLGEAIFTQMFVETGNAKKVSNLESELVSNSHSLVEYYRRCSTEDSFLACNNSTQRPQPISQSTEQAAINHKMLQSFAGLHLKTQKLEKKLAKLEASREADAERIKNDVMNKIRVDLNKLFE